MYAGLAISLIMHVGLLAWALITIRHAPEDRPVVEVPVAVALVTADEITRLRKGDRSAKELDAVPKEAPKVEPPRKEAPKPTPQAAAEPPPPAAEAEPPKPPEPAKAEPKPDPIAEKMAALAKEPPPAPEVAPGPTPEELKKAEEERVAAEQKKKAEEAKKRAEEEKKRKEEAKRKEDERKKKLAEAEAKRKKQQEQEFSKISDLLNKIPDKGAPTPAADKSETPTKNKGPVAGAPEGRDNRLTASELSLLIGMIKSCVDGQYRRLNGSTEADQLVFDLRIRLNQDGTLVAPPQVVNGQNSAYFLAASENAVRAATSCAPYQLPPDKYAYWKDVILQFGKTQ